MRRVLTRLIHARSLDDPNDPARDLAAVLHERVTTWLDTNAELCGRFNQAPTPAGELIPFLGETDPDDNTHDTIREIDGLIRARLDALTHDAVHAQPAWLHPVGTEPEHPADSAPWRDAVATLAAYRDLNCITGTAPLGRDTSRDDTDRQRRRLAAHAAATAHQLAHDLDRTPVR